VGWSLNVIPVPGPADNEVLEWAASASFSRGVPDQPPNPKPLPSVGDVLAAFRAAGCHGTVSSNLSGTDPTAPLEECPDPAVCSSVDGLDLGEVSLRVVGQDEHDQALEPTASVEAMSFRKPVPAAVLAAACALALSAGPQLVFDDSADSVFVVWPGERADDLVAEWPW
jgi:hypothetical protein